MKSDLKDLRLAQSSHSLEARVIAAILLAFAASGLSLAFGQTPTRREDRGIGLKPGPGQVNQATGAARGATERPELILQTGHSEKVDCLAFSPDGRYLASGSNDQTIKLWDVLTGRELRAIAGHNGGVRAVAFSPDGQWLASGGSDGRIKLWDVTSGAEIISLNGHSQSVSAVAFSRDGRLLASGGTDYEVKVWDLGVKRETHTLRGHYGWVLALTFSPDGQT